MAVGGYHTMVLILDIIQQRYLTISLILKLLVGVFPDREYEHSCYIRFAQYTNNLGIEDGPHGDSYEKIIDCPSHYSVRDPVYRGNLGYTFDFGGPGGICGS